MKKSEFIIKPIGKVCKLCSKEVPVVKLTNQNLKLCKECFNRIQEKRVKEVVEKYKMFDMNDNIGIYLSGGKDSLSLAFILKKIFPDYNFKAIFLNLGIKHFSDYSQKIVEEFSNNLKLPLYVYNLQQKEGFSIDDFVFTKFKNKICSVCGTIKRYLFSKIAKELKLTVIATGHHMDDLVVTYLDLFFTGDFLSISRLYPVNQPLYEGQAKKVKPLCKIPEEEIFYYASLNGITFSTFSCPHGKTARSRKTKMLLENISKENRTFKYQLLSVFLNKLIPVLREKYKQEKLSFSFCIKCNELTLSPNNLCSYCRRLELLKKSFQ